MYLAITHALCRDWRAARSCAEATIAHSKEYGFPQTLWLCSCIHGRALVQDGRPHTGIPQLEEAVAARKAIGVAAGRLFELALLAEAYAVAERHDEGLRVVAEALDFADRTGEGFYLPEIHRLEGELRLRQGASEEAIDCFRRGLAAARRQQAKSLELRAATGLAGRWARQAKHREARDLLAPVYDWFTEGFATQDLKDAKAVLEALR